MALYSMETKRSQEQVLAKAAAFFGAGGVGLEMEQRGDCCAYFQGGGGYVQVSVAAAGGGKTAVEIETREWDYQVRTFMAEVH